MEKFRRRSEARARVSSLFQEDQRIGKENSSPVLGSGSSSYIQLFDQGKISSSLPTGTPMKKLLADEMSKETESKRRSPSVIARLMGLDGLPSHHNCNKPRKKNTDDDHHQDSSSSGFLRSSSNHYGQSKRKSVKGQQQFKDVYEVVERSNRESRNCSSHTVHDRNPSEDEIAFIRQKFMDVKRFSSDEKLRNSKEFHDALDVLDSNKSILLKFLQEPDSLFLKHLYEMRGASESHWEHFSKMKSTNTLKNSVDGLGNRSGRKVALNNDTNHCHKRSSSCNGNLYHRRNLDFQNSILLGDGMEVTSIPTRIVVLKPNLGKVKSSSKSAFSPSSSHVEASDVDVCSEYSSIMHAESKMGHNCDTHREFDITDRRSQESRELAKEITRRMKHNLGIESSNIFSSEYYGYSADESGQDMSENDSSYDSEWPTIGSQSPSNRSIHKKASTSRYAESHVSREAKRRLSERWKMTRRSHHIGGSSKGSTLAEMLAIPDVDIRTRVPNNVGMQDECFHSVERHAKTVKLNGPLGISTRDGWKDGCVHNLTRSRSLDTERLSRNEGISHLINLPLKKGSKQLSTEKINSAQVIKWSRGRMSKSLDEKDSFELQGDIIDRSFNKQDTTSPPHDVADENINVFGSESCSGQQIPAPQKSSDIVSRENPSACDSPPVQQEPSSSYVLLDTATQPESPLSSKESEQPSPVSVLETPFVEELSSGSECFERVSADLHGLRMQLQLLKLESESYDGASALISSDDDVELSTNNLPDSNELIGVGESWESSYLLDVLTESNLDKTDPELFLSTWHTSDCPIAFGVFETVEKKYNVSETCLRSDRRLLFDLINLKMVEISHQHLNLYPWVKQRKNISSLWWEKQWFETELRKLLERHKKQMLDNTTDVAMLDSMPWLELVAHIDSIGRDIEGLLMDDLVGDLVAFK